MQPQQHEIVKRSHPALRLGGFLFLLAALSGCQAARNIKAECDSGFKMEVEAEAEVVEHGIALPWQK